MNKSIDHELLVKELYETILKNEKVQTISVAHNVKIQGRSGAVHQFDVYWEFKIAGVLYRTCIECKHLSSRVKKSHVTDFASKIEDVGNANGVFVTTVGYQEGAIVFAQNKGIQLLLANYLLQSVSVIGEFRLPITTLTAISFDKEHADELKKQLGVSHLTFSFSATNNTVLYDSEGSSKGVVLDFLRSIKSQDGFQEVEMDGLYFLTEFGLLRIKSFSVEKTYEIIKQNWLFELGNPAKAIIEDILTDEKFYLNNDGTIAVN